MTMTTSWRESKDAGRQAVLDSNYQEALFQYSEAIDKLLSSASSSLPASAAEERRRVDHDGRSGRTANSSSSSSSSSSRVGQQQQQRPFQHEHQILLSNVIACRLKIGGTDMAEKAVEEAKQVSATHSSF